MKKRPFCAEEIQEAAIKCRYCGEMILDVDQSPGEETTASIADAPMSATEGKKKRSLAEMALVGCSCSVLAVGLPIAIIGIIAAILIPNFLDAMQKAQQKATVADIRNTGTAWMSWMTDQVSAGAAGQRVNQLEWDTEFSGTCATEDLAEILEGGKYLQRMPFVDGWGNPLQFGVVDGLDCSDSSTYVKLITAVRALGIRSLGRDGEEDGGSYTAGRFPVTNYDSDIVWADGYFVRSPGGTGTADEEEE